MKESTGPTQPTPRCPTGLMIISAIVIAAMAASPALANDVDLSTGGSAVWTTSPAGGTRDNGYINGTVPGSADGFWTTTTSFILPTNATNVSLSYSDLYGDDRVAIELNGTILGVTGLYVAPDGSVQASVPTTTVGMFSFTDVASTPYTYTPGQNKGRTTTGFNVGVENALTLIVNNTQAGIQGGLTPSGNGDGSLTAMNATLHYDLAAAGGGTPADVPEPAGIATVALLALGLGTIAHRRKNTNR